MVVSLVYALPSGTMRFDSSYPKTEKDETGAFVQQKDPASDRPMWSVRVMYRPASGRADFIKVSVPGKEKPEFRPETPLKFDGFRIGSYSRDGGRSGLYFKADAVSSLEG